MGLLATVVVTVWVTRTARAALRAGDVRRVTFDRERGTSQAAGSSPTPFVKRLFERLLAWQR